MLKNTTFLQAKLWAFDDNVHATVFNTAVLVHEKMSCWSVSGEESKLAFAVAPALPLNDCLPTDTPTQHHWYSVYARGAAISGWWYWKIWSVAGQYRYLWWLLQKYFDISFAVKLIIKTEWPKNVAMSLAVSSMLHYLFRSSEVAKSAHPAFQTL